MSPEAIQGILNSPFVQITLPLLVPIIWGFTWQHRDLQDIKTRLSDIEKVLREHGERIARLEERIPPLVHR